MYILQMIHKISKICMYIHLYIIFNNLVVTAYFIYH